MTDHFARWLLSPHPHRPIFLIFFFFYSLVFFFLVASTREGSEIASLGQLKWSIQSQRASRQSSCTELKGKVRIYLVDEKHFHSLSYTVLKCSLSLSHSHSDDSVSMFVATLNAYRLRRLLVTALLQSSQESHKWGGRDEGRYFKCTLFPSLLPLD